MGSGDKDAVFAGGMKGKVKCVLGDVLHKLAIGLGKLLWLAALGWASWGACV